MFQFKKQAELILTLDFYLTQYIQNTIIFKMEAIYWKKKKTVYLFYFFFPTKSLKAHFYTNSTQFRLTTFHVLTSPMWLVAGELDSIVLDHESLGAPHSAAKLLWEGSLKGPPAHSPVSFLDLVVLHEFIKSLGWVCHYPWGLFLRIRRLILKSVLMLKKAKNPMTP